MKRIIFTIIKILCWIWIVIMGTILLSSNFSFVSILVIILLTAAPISFLVWRFKEEAEERSERKKERSEQIKEIEQIQRELKKLTGKK